METRFTPKVDQDAQNKARMTLEQAREVLRPHVDGYPFLITQEVWSGFDLFPDYSMFLIGINGEVSKENPNGCIMWYGKHDAPLDELVAQVIGELHIKRHATARTAARIENVEFYPETLKVVSEFQKAGE